ncbi:MAG: sigma-70 family RNA polymerase sigma factor [Bryobacteraceae bacterium]
MDKRSGESGNGESHPVDVTQLLSAFRAGDRGAEELLFQAVHRELKLIARRRLRSERKGHTMQPTALVGEAYEKLINQRQKTWHNKAHFMAVASRVMRQVLIDYARRRKSSKRGGSKELVELNDAQAAVTPNLDIVLAVHEALEQLAEFDERQARIVEMVFFGGLTQEQVAESFGLDVRTIKRDWEMARAWLAKRLASQPARSAAGP